MRSRTPQDNIAQSCAGAPEIHAPFLERAGAMCYINGTFILQRRPYGDRSRQGSQDEKEAPEERQAHEGAGKNAEGRQEGQEGLGARLGGLSESSDFGLDRVLYHGRNQLLDGGLNLFLRNSLDDLGAASLRLCCRALFDLLSKLRFHRPEMLTDGLGQ